MIYTIIDANGMGTSSGVHIRLMISRGLKSTPYQNPKVTLGKPTIVILPEWKEAAPGGIRLLVWLTRLRCSLYACPKERGIAGFCGRKHVCTVSVHRARGFLLFIASNAIACRPKGARHPAVHGACALLAATTSIHVCTAPCFP
jgi:hypothetical protein